MVGADHQRDDDEAEGAAEDGRLDKPGRESTEISGDSLPGDGRNRQLHRSLRQTLLQHCQLAQMYETLAGWRLLPTQFRSHREPNR